MKPEVVAAIIAASVSLLTLIGTLAAQYFGRLATNRDTERTLRAQGEHLERTLAEQRSQTLTEWFGTAAEQLGHERPGVRVAAIYALEQIAKAAPQLRAPIHELLSAYIRAESTWAHHDPATLAAVEATPGRAVELPLLKIRAPDVQAAVTV